MSTAIAPEELVFREEDHSYWRNGQRVPSVTQILAGLGLIDSRHFTEESRVRGKAVHAAVHYHLEGDLDWSSVDERIKGYLEAAITFLEDSRFEALAVEQRVWHLTYPIYAGTGDAFGILPARSQDTVADWKSGAIEEVHGLQTALYDIARGGPRRRRIGVQLRPDGKYRKRDFEDRWDYDRALSAADLYTKFIFDRRAA